MTINSAASSSVSFENEKNSLTSVNNYGVALRRFVALPPCPTRYPDQPAGVPHAGHKGLKIRHLCCGRGNVNE